MAGDARHLTERLKLANRCDEVRLEDLGNAVQWVSRQLVNILDMILVEKEDVN